MRAQFIKSSILLLGIILALSSGLGELLAVDEVEEPHVAETAPAQDAERDAAAITQVAKPPPEELGEIDFGHRAAAELPKHLVIAQPASR